MLCIYCHKTATATHHVIKRDKRKKCNGTDNTENLAPLCQKCHYAIHHGTDSELRKSVLNKCYEFIKPNLDKCWVGKYPPKIIKLLENEQK